MSDPTSTQPGIVDRNLLYGMLALQMEFIRQDRLVAAMQAWVFDKARPLGQILVGQGHLTPERHQLLNALVEEHLKAHSDDPRQCLASLPVHPALEQEFQRLGDDEVRASLAGLATCSQAAAEATLPYSAPCDENTVVSSHYRILRPLARGGLGEVRVAEDLELHREVALKEIQHRYASDAQSQTRFLLEAEITGRLEHPGIVPVHGLGRYADGRPFYAMRLVQGETLQEAIRQFHEAVGPARDPGEHSLALRRLLTRFVAVCNAVAFAHNRGVIHRDLKPANIMLGKYGETLILDWGLAKVVGRKEAAAVEGEQTLHPLSGDGLATQAGSAIGTACFMSPEQAAGRIDRQGPASDIYSLGATLYTLLTGRAPFEAGELAVILYKVEVGEWLPPRQVKKDVPGALDAICRKAMALAPQDRYATALDLGADVEQWLADEPVSAWREPISTRLWRWCKRRPVISAWIGISITLYLVVIGMSLAAEFANVSESGSIGFLIGFITILTALAMSVAAQGTAILGAAAGFTAGFFSRRDAQRKQRATRWAVRGTQVGLIVGAALGYAGMCWLYSSMPGTSQLTTSFKLTLIGVIALCPILGIFLGMLLGSWKGLRLGGSIVGGVVGACIAIGITITLVMNYQQTLRQQLETSRRWDYLRLVDAQLNLKRHVEAAQSAAELSDIFPDNSDNAFAAAGCLARCLPVAEQDTKLTESDRAKLIEKYGHDAVSMLREAVRRGYQDVAQMKRHTDLDPIRERQDFQELLVEIQNKEKRGIGR